ncbi:MAG: hypothetical protein CK547_00760 [Chitinophagaceae bacterium]|nr:MAG: hypothetical protein CK547_00760 [Chitinophagaceae bacterium]
MKLVVSKQLYYASNALIALLFLTTTATAQRTASVSGNWNSTATWGGSAVPTSTDAVTIANGVTVTVNVSNAVCSSLQLGGTAANTLGILTFAATGSPKLTVSGATTVGGSGSTNANRRGEILFVSGSTFETGTLKLTQGASNNPAVINMGSGGCLLKTGAITDGGGVLTYTSGGSIEINATTSLPNEFSSFNILTIFGDCLTSFLSRRFILIH